MQDERFKSVLSEEGRTYEHAAAAAPSYFRDLHLDQVVDAITAAHPSLASVFACRLTSLDDIHFRREVMEDLENRAVFDCIEAFLSAMGRMHTELAHATAFHCAQQKTRWFLEGAKTYCAAISALAAGFSQLTLGSRALRALAEYVSSYSSSAFFKTLLSDTTDLLAELDSIIYCVHVKGRTVTVRRYESEPDYTETVTRTFARFGNQPSSGAASSDESVELSHVDAHILELVARLFPEAFSRLDGFAKRYEGFTDPTLLRFEHEVRFYTLFLAYIEPLRSAGLAFCWPSFSDKADGTYAHDSFDVALAAKLLSAGERVVTNDFELNGGERIMIVSGPNQGGKTTFARMVGQLHHFASIGCLVPGSSARLLFVDAIFAHFEREESVATLRSKLEDDLVRVRDILAEATDRSLILINEIFSSTTLSDAYELARRVMARVVDIEALCVCVTFLEDLSRTGKPSVSLVGGVDPRDPAIRTFKIERRAADGASYALSVAERHRLTYQQIVTRIGRSL